MHGEWSHKIKRPFLLGRKAMTNLDSVLKSRDITLWTKAYIVKAIVFVVIMSGCKSWTIKMSESWRTVTFELWVLERSLLRVPWTARRSNQSILKEISPEHSLQGLMLKLQLQYFGLLMWKANSLEKTLMLGKIEDRRKRGWQRMRWFGWHHCLNGHKFEQTPGNSEGQGSVACHSSWVAFPGGSVVKNQPANPGDAGDMVWYLGQEDPLEEEMATLSSILPGESHGQRSLVGYSSWACKELDMTEHTYTQMSPYQV